MNRAVWSYFKLQSTKIHKYIYYKVNLYKYHLFSRNFSRMVQNEIIYLNVAG